MAGQQRTLSDRGMMYYLFILGFFAIFSTTISKDPVLPLFSQALGANDTIIGLISAVSPFAGIVLSFPVGVLSDHIGRRRLLVASGFVFLLAPVLYVFITDPVWLIPVRFFHGMATAILGPVISAVVIDRFPERKGEMLGQYSSATYVGRMLAPLSGGIIITALGSGLFSYHAVYIAACLAGIPVFALTLMYREESSGPINILPFSVYKESLGAFVANPGLRATALVDMATYFAYGALETFLPVLLSSLHFSAYEIGIVFAIQILAIAATKPFFGKLADKIDKRYQIAGGILLTGISIAVIPFCSIFWEFLAVSFLFGLGMSLSSVATSAYVGDIAKRDSVGASMGALSSIMDIGQSSGPLITGAVITLAGYTFGFFASFLLAMIVCAVFVLTTGKHG